MAIQRDGFRAYNYEDSMSLDDLLMQIQQPQIDTEAIARQQAEARAQAEAQVRAQQEAQRQAQIAAEQRAYEEQVYRQAQARQEELRAQNAARLAAEQQAIAEQEATRQVFNQRQPEQPITAQEVINQIAAQPTPAQPTQSAQQAPDKASIINNLVGQIKARSNTSQWSGGYGADEATKDMARILADTGITDISQFGPITQQVERVVGYEEWGAPIYQTVTEQTFGNKETGQAVPNTYSERQKGDFFGGTFEGKGNTGYGVQFDAQGQPIFYTQGASSADPIVKAAVPIASLALAAMGAPSIVGNALLGAGANQVAAGALGGAVIGGGTAALTDQDVGKGALLGGAGGALTGYLRGDLAGVTSAEINAASDAASTMADSGLSIAEINNQLEIAGFKPAAIASALEDASNIISAPSLPTSLVDQPIPLLEPITAVTPSAPLESVQITAPAAPSTIGNVISAIATPVPEQPPFTGTITNAPPEPVEQPIENVQITTPPVQPTAPTTVSDVISAIAQQSAIAPEPVAQPIETVQIATKAEPPQETPTIANVISAISTPSPELVIATQAEKPPEAPPEEPPAIPLIMSPTAPTSVPTEPVKSEKEKEKSWTAAELAELARLGLLATTVLGAAEEGPQRFPIVPIPADWKSPTYGKGSTSVAPTQLPPIDFGNRELLRGTQWEKFLDPNYGQVPAPVQFNQPTNMSYDRLMSILGTGRDVLPSQALTINDVISGIQNQYGQTTNSAMGQKPT
jgi:hypothetical protein